MAAAGDYRDFQLRGGVADLSDRVKLTLTGADRVRYLNGQVTSDVRKLAPGQTQPACVTTAKGKLCGEIIITDAADAFLIDADPSLAESLAARLERYIVADDVTLAELPPDTRLLHFAGCEPNDLPPFGPPLHSARRFGVRGCDLWTDAATAESLWPQITARFPVVDEPLLEAIRIERGVPRWGRELDEDTLPPEAGLDRTHIDYAKGCYIGQEVISRLKSVGHVNRRLAAFVAAGESPLAPGMEIFPADQREKPIGRITSAAWSFFMAKPIALGYLKRGSPPGELIARGADEIPVTAHELPLVSP